MSRVFYCLFIFSIDFLLAMFVAGQENYAVKTFTTDHGLPHNHVRSIAQDQNGFLWIATWDGLSRYDGYEFRNYYHNPADTNSLVYFQIENVLVDCKNNVWVNCYAGISRYNRDKDNFTQFPEGFVGSGALDKDGQIWFSTQKGLKRWNYESKRFELVPMEIDDQFKAMNKVHTFWIDFDNENRMWITIIHDDYLLFYRCNTDKKDGLIAVFIGSLKYSNYFPDLNNPRWSYEHLVTRTDDYWFLSSSGNFKLDHKSNQFLPFLSFNFEDDLTGLKPDVAKKFKENIEYYKPNNRVNNSSLRNSPIHINTYLIDNQKSLWQGILSTGSLATGLTYSVPVSNGFKHYFLDQNTENKLNPIFPVLKDRFGTVWAGPTNQNLIFRLDKKGLTTLSMPISNQNTWRSARQPRSFLEDSTGIWIGYFNNLLLRYDFKSSQFTEEIFKKTNQKDFSLPPSFVHLIKEGDEIFIFGYIGIFKYNIKTRKTTILKLFDSSPDFNLYSCLRDENNGWWIGGSAGKLFHYDNQFNEIAHYAIGTSRFNIEGIISGDNNDLWISQLGGGMARFDKLSGKAEIFTTSDGLSNNTCYGLLKDEHGNIWISTNHGISRFNPKARQFRVFGPEDGLKIDEFNSDNTYLAPDGEMFFGGMGGVVSFYPDSIADTGESHIISPLVIEDFKVSGTNRYFSKAIYECDTVTLFKGDTNFQLTFACLDFKNADKIKYRYRLEGEDHDFVQTDSRHRFLNYASLSPGKYKLLIEATNLDGDWASRTSLLVIIPAYFYQTAWFKLLFTVFLLLSAGHFIYSYNHRIRLKAKQQQEELRLESLRGQMNPHFIFNSLNSINYFISQNDRLSANRYIADFSRLIRSILGNMSNEYISLTLELESLHDYLKLEHLRFGDKFDYTIQVYEGISSEELSVFPGMVQPFIENAIWHGVRGLEGRKGMVNIEFRLANKDCLICVVEDDGIGRIRSEKCKSNLPGKTSRGISIVLERLKIINNLRQTNFQVKIDDLFNDREETGTRVIIEIPVKI